MEEITKEIEKLIDEIDYPPLKTFVIKMFEALANMSEEDARNIIEQDEYLKKRMKSFIETRKREELWTMKEKELKK